MAVAAAEAGFRVAGMVENLDRERCRRPLSGLPVLWIDDVADLASTHAALCGLGTTRRQAFVHQAAAVGLPFATVVHPQATVSPSATLGEGCYVSARAVVGAGVRLHDHVIVLQGALVGCSSAVGPFSSLLQGANVGRGCRLQASVYLGAGAVVADGIAVGEGAVVGAGAVLLDPLPPRSLALGVPARLARTGIDPR